MSKQATLAAPGAAHKRSSKQLREQIDAYTMLLPTILGVMIFFAVPLAISLYLSFTSARISTAVGEAKFVGLENYLNVFKDSNFYLALRNTMIFSAATLLLSTVPALILAVLLNEKIRGQAFFRALFFIPVVASVVAVSLLWRYLLNIDFGFVNYAFSLLGLPRIPWLTSPDWALLSVILVFSWKTIGYNMVIFLAGLQGISRPLYEAASIDGATRWQQFMRITVPMLSPTTFFILITTLINCLQVFDVPYALGYGRSTTIGPADSMLTVVPLLYREGFILDHMGYSSSLAWVLFIMIMAITFLQFRISNRWVNYE
ncbi:MAG TPA: sugar ABC transporter permease [Kouleothrix sp.]|uniref:carbohydrate ABC transporter permease n=1 Tax=Kouleothrix sp. TaxID=2779161 RepID=UPI002B72FCDD|nr:sugar ABC transporter permease [Kouleothrix sp.]HRC75069.1 sugar ABC transporter permease [Kouleothrix sp.]